MFSKIASSIFAHSSPDRPVTEWQRLSDHSQQVADQAAAWAGAFASADWAWNAGLLHDLGKADATFQAYLRRENGLDDSAYETGGRSKVNHSSAGAALAEEAYGCEEFHQTMNIADIILVGIFVARRKR